MLRWGGGGQKALGSHFYAGTTTTLLNRAQSKHAAAAVEKKGNQVNGGKVCSVYGISSLFRLLFLGFVLYREREREREGQQSGRVLSSANKQCPRPLLSGDTLVLLFYKETVVFSFQF